MLKSKSELEIVNLMNYELVKTANNQDFSNLEQAVNYLDSAIDVLDNNGFTNEANKLLNILTKIAKHHKPKNPTNVSKRHSEKFVKNLKETGTMFSKKDFNMADDLLNADIEFEDEDDPELEV
jgi:hypothetical protein